MEIILLQKISKLGNMGDTVRVKQGFGRNFLIPTGKALRATKENKAFFEETKAKLLEENKEAIEKAEKLRTEVESLKLAVVRSASDTGILYGSVTTRDISNLISAEGVTVSRKHIALDQPIKELGIYDVSIIFHPEVESKIKLRVVRSLGDKHLRLKIIVSQIKTLMKLTKVFSKTAFHSKQRKLIQKKRRHRTFQKMN